MTWDEFKKAVEAAGVQPDDEVDYIDMGAGDALDVVVTGSSTGARHFRVTD